MPTRGTSPGGTTAGLRNWLPASKSRCGSMLRRLREPLFISRPCGLLFFSTQTQGRPWISILWNEIRFFDTSIR
ncbi:hypothetical protein CEXT_720541 [Caerostris extrusa]|uniref:Uncharacterized protein n=1 Tax=Caerostris extrusa TaxID=172846 RepID=A0AAV4SKK7_CAEEX|nr:hypothetical protein CEXT_720541 [Caerostris extrusa]